MKFLEQIVPQELCLKCDVCCRFSEKNTLYSPFFMQEEIEKLEDKSLFPFWESSRGMRISLKKNCYSYICPFFNLNDRHCINYNLRPFDCKLYPFMLTYDRNFKNVIITLDKKCPYVSNIKLNNIKEYINYLINILEYEELVKLITKNFGIIGNFDEDLIEIKILKNLSKSICKSEYNLKKISIEDKGIFEYFFKKCDNKLSSYSFQYLFVWSDLLNIVWKIIDETLCVFAESGGIFFMPIPPVGNLSKRILEEIIYILRKNNKILELRIEDLKESDIQYYYNNFKIKEKSSEYIYLREKLASLKGRMYKSKRASYNHFIKNYKFEYKPYNLEEDYEQCINLYIEWAKKKSQLNDDKFFNSLIADNFFANRKAFLYFEELGLIGRVIKIDKIVRGYTFGYEISKDTFIIMSEICDPKFKGISQFIFKEFCNELKNYRFINCMDDSYLINLKKVKLSYRPEKIEKSFIGIFQQF